MEYTFNEYKKSNILKNHLRLGGENPSGEKIEVNSLYLERGGKPWIAIMGEYHFSRAHRENWYTEMCKMKAGGITAVATYLFWIYHEEEEGCLNFSEDLDIRGFVLAAQKAGLDVVLRIGPWAHGECRNGGFPEWLLKKPFKLRDNNEEYLSLVKKWYGAISNEVKGLLYKDGGNIVAIQLENELVDRAEHLAKLKEIAAEVGLIVPLYTVTGWNSKYGARIPVDEVLPVFGGYPDAPWARGTGKLPLSKNYAFYTMRNDTAIGADIIKEEAKSWQLPYEKYPFATCELGPGMQSTHHRRVVISPMDAYAMALTKLGAGNNLCGYYMYHGGTNKIGKNTNFVECKSTGYPNDYPVLNYDFGTCLSEYGEVRGQYRYLNLLHLFLKDFGEFLAPMESVGASEFVDENNLCDLRYCMRTDGNSGFVFVNNYQRHAKLPWHKDVVFKTESVTFPPVSVPWDTSFILPFNLPIEGGVLRYSTCQLLCREDNVYFFVKIPEIDAVYCFEDDEPVTVTEGLYQGFVHNGNRFVTLSFEDALFLRRIDGKLYVGSNADLYGYYDEIDEKNEIGCVEPGDFSYSEWSGSAFYEQNVEVDARPASWEITECEPQFELDARFSYELSLDTDEDVKISWKKLVTDASEGFVVIDEKYNVAQIYKDKVLIADKFYDGTSWRIPASLLCGETYLVMSEFRKDVSIGDVN